MPLRTAALLVLIGFALASAVIFATEAAAAPPPRAPVEHYNPLP